MAAPNKNNISLIADDKNQDTFNQQEDFNKSSNQDKGDNDITPLELELLDGAGINESGDDDILLGEAQLDDKDEDGEMLNETSDLTGEDLDIPGNETEDDSGSIAEEDEENNSYSIRDQDDENDNDPL